MTTHTIHVQMLKSLLAPIADLLEDPTVSEIMINGHARIYCERQGRITLEAHVFPSDAVLLAALRNIAQFVGRPLDPQHPVLEARLPDGSRVQAVIPPAAQDGPAISIRRFSPHVVTLTELIAARTMSESVAAQLSRAIEQRQNVVVSGGTGTGKTSLLNALSSFIPEHERVIVLEDARELRLQRQHVVQLETQVGDGLGRGALGMRELFRASLRMRPDRLVLGEIRGAEALELIQAMTSGHDGCLSTVHASSPADALARLETMAMMSDVRMPLPSLRKQLASGLDLIVQIARQRDGTRCVTHVCRVRGLTEAGDYQVEGDETESCARAAAPIEGAARGVWNVHAEHAEHMEHSA
jgi:pilus assembly protein CpaF